MFSLGVLSANAQQFTVTGITSDESGEALAGVTVAVKGTSTGVASDNDGKYSITVPGRDAVLVFSYVGYNQQEIPVGSQTVINAQLKSDTELEEVVVTGLGITKEARAVGYAVTSIKASELTKVGTPNFATALYGKAPGVRIQQVQGGSIAGVSITVRGLSSITGSTQPLVVMNGVPIRNGGTGSGNEATFAEFGAEGRIRGNGLIDINPEDIEDLTILKGAAATALYGSEAANGVVMITSKRARKGEGLTVDFNATLTSNRVAYVPKLQDQFGPGSAVTDYNADEKQTGGFSKVTYNGQIYERPSFGKGFYSKGQWGPAYDGRDVLYWDGKVRPYNAYSGDPWKELFRTGFNENYNLAINYGSEKASTRFSYTFNHEIPNALVGNYVKHNFNLTGTLNISKNISVDYSANYVVQKIKDRAGSGRNALGLYMSSADAFGSFMDIELMKKWYKTSLGYRRTHLGGDRTLTPDEVFIVDSRDDTEVRGLSELLWDNYERRMNETSNRLIASIAPQWKIVDWLTLRGRMSTDITADKEDYKQATERPLAYFDPSGSYSVTQRRYDIMYGDVMLLVNKNLVSKLDLSVNLGWQGRYENMLNIRSYTDGGLAAENWFALQASRYQARTDYQTQELLKTAYVGTIGLSWDNYLYLDITGRQEKTSTLREGNNVYFYPSFSGSFIFTDAFRDALPQWWNYGKIRTSYGIVGNAPSVYQANVVYEQQSGNGFTYNHIPGTLGNADLVPETTKEFEVGLESKFAKNRLGFELTYYTRNIEEMLLETPMANSSGASRMWFNVGSMKNTGVELNLYGTPVLNKDFSWNTTINVSRNYNEVTYLIDGVDFIQNAGWGGDAALLRSYVGRPMGDFYVQTAKRDANGNKLINDDGLYINDAERARAGNAMPVVIGGFINQFTYKDFFFDVLIDYSIGGKVFNETYHYASGQGLTEKTLENRTTERGGLSYYFPGNDNGGKAVAISSGSTSGPNGERVYQNGVIQEGIVESTGQNNQQIVPADKLYANTYAWGTSGTQYTGEVSIFDKTYVKVREIAIGYTLPKSISSKFMCKRLQLSVFGRNLFYIYKAMPDYDVESSVGTSWTNQAQIGGSTAPMRSFGISLRASF
ncbi:MAG: SusC/RagA family TonB-linked outer membrane protein [Prevotellaceae bacterium]|nr:SusC/RagA family TonB-linked outer membrane protein [Prevotellaceae bacterium]